MLSVSVSECYHEDSPIRAWHLGAEFISNPTWMIKFISNFIKKLLPIPVFASLFLIHYSKKLVGVWISTLYTPWEIQKFKTIIYFNKLWYTRTKHFGIGLFKSVFVIIKKIVSYNNRGLLFEVITRKRNSIFVAESISFLEKIEKLFGVSTKKVFFCRIQIYWKSWYPEDFIDCKVHHKSMWEIFCLTTPESVIGGPFLDLKNCFPETCW